MSLHDGNSWVEPHVSTVLPQRWTVVCLSVFLNDLRIHSVMTRGNIHRALEVMVVVEKILCI